MSVIGAGAILNEFKPVGGPDDQRVEIGGSLLERAMQNDKDALTLCVALSRDVIMGEYYRALTKCRKLFDFENARLMYVPAGLREDSASV